MPRSRRIHIILTALLLLSVSTAPLFAKGFMLFHNGVSHYCIVADTLASKRDAFAVRELQKYMSKISGVTFSVVRPQLYRGGMYIAVGDNSLSRKMVQTSGMTLAADDSFCYLSDDKGNISINGVGKYGLPYAVYGFLEEVVGCRWYTSTEEFVPRLDSLLFTSLRRIESPGFKYRYVMYKDAMDPSYCLKIRNNGANSILGVHTFTDLLPAKEHFASHPEYFSLRDGKRLGEDTQLCLSNTDVVRLVTEALLKRIAAYPAYPIYDVSQNDNLNFCQCPRCTALARQYGGQSGLMLHFVNQIAREVKKRYPDKYVSTFAYKYTRNAPRGIRPDDNVFIRLCSIECCCAHGFDSCERNASFIRDLKAWQSLTHNLYVWNYVTNFQEYCLPDPNFAAAVKDIRILRDFNVTGILEEGNYQCRGGEFSLLRSYLLSKLLWNPDADADAIVNEFISGYYSKAGRHIRKYYDLLESLALPDCHFGYNFGAGHEMFSGSFIKEAKAICAEALAASDNQTIRNRVELVMMPVFYLDCKRNPIRSRFNGSFDFVRKVIEREAIPYLYEDYSNVPNSQNFLK